MVFGLRVERGNGERRYLSYGFFPATKPLVHRDFLSKASKRKPRIHLVRPATHQLVGVNIQGRQRKRLPAQRPSTTCRGRLVGPGWFQHLRRLVHIALTRDDVPGQGDVHRRALARTARKPEITFSQKPRITPV